MSQPEKTCVKLRSLVVKVPVMHTSKNGLSRAATVKIQGHSQSTHSSYITWNTEPIQQGPAVPSRESQVHGLTLRKRGSHARSCPCTGRYQSLGQIYRAPSLKNAAVDSQQLTVPVAVTGRGQEGDYEVRH